MLNKNNRTKKEKLDEIEKYIYVPRQYKSKILAERFKSYKDEVTKIVAEPEEKASDDEQTLLLDKNNKIKEKAKFLVSVIDKSTGFIESKNNQPGFFANPSKQYKNKTNFFENKNVPKEIIECITAFLNTKDLAALSQVNQSFKELVNEMICSEKNAIFIIKDYFLIYKNGESNLKFGDVPKILKLYEPEKVFSMVKKEDAYVFFNGHKEKSNGMRRDEACTIISLVLLLLVAVSVLALEYFLLKKSGRNNDDVKKIMVGTFMVLSLLFPAALSYVVYKFCIKKDANSPRFLIKQRELKSEMESLFGEKNSQDNTAYALRN